MTTTLVYASGECELDSARRELRVDGSSVPLGGRAFEILEALAESAGQLVTKNKLIDRIWPGAIVEDSTLYVHTAAVRKALGPYRTLLKTESGRGYRLLGDWTVRHQAAAPVGQQPVRFANEAPVTNFPATVSPLVGRTDAVARLRDLLSAWRVVTLTGPGGIGKTVLGLQAARGIIGEFADGAWLVELAALADPALLPVTVANALWLEPGSSNIVAETVARAIQERQLLLLLDNCEHLIDAVASLVETLLARCPHVTILATSQEALRVNGEHVYRVTALTVPDSASTADAEISRHSAPALFMRRAGELGAELSAVNPVTIAAICRHLDGIPLAIEFAAARAAALGVEMVVAGLRERFSLLTTGRRTALPRHRTLRATLDWSYRLLSAVDRDQLDRLAIFPGVFTIDEATSVSADNSTASDIANRIADLVSRSLVVRLADTTVSEFRLLETTRVYATERLRESGAFNEVARRYAVGLLRMFEAAEADGEMRPMKQWRDDHGSRIDHLRAALDWCFSPHGDTDIGVALTATAIPLWLASTLFGECRERVGQALAVPRAVERRDRRHEMKMLSALAATSVYTLGPTGGAREHADQALAIAQELNDAEHQSRALWCLWVYHLANSEPRRTLDIARYFSELPETRPGQGYALFGERLMGISEHFLGELPEAREHLRNVVANTTPSARETGREFRFWFDPSVTARSHLARVLWLMGFPDQAASAAAIALERARNINHPSTLCYTLGEAACQIALWRDDLSAAELYADTLVDASTRHALPAARPVGLMFQAAVMLRRGDIANGLVLLRAGLADEREPVYAWARAMFLLELAGGLVGAGRDDDALGAIEQGIERCERTEERWPIAEFLRLRGELLARSGMPGALAAADEQFRLAMDWSRRQGALTFELRAALSRARLAAQLSRAGDAATTLRAVYARFTEGFETADLRTARQMLDELR